VLGHGIGRCLLPSIKFLPSVSEISKVEFRNFRKKIDKIMYSSDSLLIYVGTELIMATRYLYKVMFETGKAQAFLTYTWFSHVVSQWGYKT
jgi:hypothetical protein